MQDFKKYVPTPACLTCLMVPWLQYMPETCLQALERLQPTGLSPPTIRTLAQQLCDAVLHCHKNKVVRHPPPFSPNAAGLIGPKALPTYHCSLVAHHCP